MTTLQDIGNDVTMTFVRQGCSGMIPNGTAWMVCLTYQDRTQYFPYHTGSAIPKPTLADVLASLHSDAWALDNCPTVDELMHEFGYESRRETERVHLAMRENYKALEHLFGLDFDRFMDAENDD